MDKMISMLQSVLAMMAPSFKSIDSKVGVKETSEAIIAANEITLLLISRFKDGVDVADFMAMWDKLKNDEDFKEKVQAGFDKYELIPAEASDIDAGEGLDLVSVQVGYVPKFMELFKKEEPKVEVPAEVVTEAEVVTDAPADAESLIDIK